MLRMTEVIWWAKLWQMHTRQNAESEQDANSLLLSNSEGFLAQQCLLGKPRNLAWLYQAPGTVALTGL